MFKEILITCSHTHTKEKEKKRFNIITPNASLNVFQSISYFKDNTKYYTFADTYIQYISIYASHIQPSQPIILQELDQILTNEMTQLHTK